MYVKKFQTGVHSPKDKVFTCPKCRRYLSLGENAPTTGLRCKYCKGELVFVRVMR